MKLWPSILGAGLSFLFLAVVFWPLEKAFPARKQRMLRPAWWTDLAFFLGQYLLWGGGVLALLQLFRSWLDGAMPAGFRAALAAQPWWLQAVEVIFLSDALVYWGHRLQHRVGFLWRFHSLHHSAEHLDWLAAHREHPLDTVYTMGLINLPAFLLGFPLETLAGLLAFRGVWAIYIHSNVRLPIGRLRMLVGAPELHHWHHSRQREAGNYANISPLMDILFGTYRCPPRSLKLSGSKNQCPATTSAISFIPSAARPRTRRKLGRLTDPPVLCRAWAAINHQSHTINQLGNQNCTISAPFFALHHSFTPTTPLIGYNSSSM